MLSARQFDLSEIPRPNAEASNSSQPDTPGLAEYVLVALTVVLEVHLVIFAEVYLYRITYINCFFECLTTMKMLHSSGPKKGWKILIYFNFVLMSKLELQKVKNGNVFHMD